MSKTIKAINKNNGFIQYITPEQRDEWERHPQLKGKFRYEVTEGQTTKAAPVKPEPKKDKAESK